MKSHVLCIVFLCFSCQLFSQSTLPYSTPSESWPEKYGNHRAIIKINKPADAVYIDFLWRRHDKNPEKRKMWIINAQTGEEVKNIQRIIINQEQCRLAFGPVTSGTYYFYYLPYKPQAGWGYFSNDYDQPENKPDIEWLKANRLDSEQGIKKMRQIPVSELQSRTEFDSFYPMEVIATRDEVQKYTKKYPSDFLIFPETREYPIRMFDALPYKWLTVPPRKALEISAFQNEYYVFQLGVYAVSKALENIQVEMSDFVSDQGAMIPATAITCFNTGGIDPYGKPFVKKVDVGQSKIQPLWMGVDIATDARPGTYKAQATVTANGEKPQQVTILLTVGNGIIADRGDGDTRKYSRLRWLNSTAGIDDEPVTPYPAMALQEQTITCLGRKVRLNPQGFPETIDSWGHQLLHAPVRMLIETNTGVVNLISDANKIIEQENGKITWQSVSRNTDMQVTCTGQMEFDGYLHYQYSIKALKDIDMLDIRLELPLQKQYAGYMMGMGRSGGYTPASHQSKWKSTEDSFWVGSPWAGVHCELTGGTYHGPLLNLYHPEPPATWNNEGKGGFRIEQGEAVTATAYSGARYIKSGQTIDFTFNLLITPVKQINYHSQFTDRYYHNAADVAPKEEDIQAGVKIINVHHANEYNPYINYPFVHNDQLRGFTKYWHQRGEKIKIYYTIRELSNYATETWALRSLGDEILGSGEGGGFPWLREHLVSDYHPQWYQHYDSISSDASIVNASTVNRWYNYYIEGLGWLVRNIDIDGLYLDDVSYDRQILKRMRKVMEKAKPGCIIDLHSNTGFSKGPVIQYAEFFPYVDKLWFGESFDYNKMSPDNWLVEVSGIPFGLMGDMLHGGGNRWRGMLYGMTVRHPWLTEGVTCDPRPVWKIWDDFGIETASMVGYWEENCPITTDQPDVLATVYLKKGKALVAIASWADQAVDVKLKINWEALGIARQKAKITIPEIQDFQEAQTYGTTVRVEPTQGKLICIDE